MTAESYYAEIRAAIVKLDVAVSAGDRPVALAALHALAPAATDLTYAIATGGPLPAKTSSPDRSIAPVRSELVEAASWGENLEVGRFGAKKAAELVDAFAAVVRADAVNDANTTLRISSADRIREEVRRATATTPWSAEQIEHYIALRAEEESSENAEVLTRNYAEALMADLAGLHQDE